MVINTDRWYLRGFLFLASAPLVWLAIIVPIFGGPAAADTLAPFVIIGIAAGVASKRGTMIGWCTWLGGFASVLALFFICLLEYQLWHGKGIRNHNLQAERSLALFLDASLPASVVGSLIGLGIGLAISKRQHKPTVDRKAHMEDIANEPGAAP